MRRAEPNWISFEGGANVRDVGGLPTVDGHSVRHGVLIRSANLQHLTSADLARFAELGVRRVVDLRTDIEVAAEGPGPVTALPEVTIHHLSLFPDASGSQQPVVRDRIDTANMDRVDGPAVDETLVDGPEVDGPEVDGPEVDGPEVDGPAVGESAVGAAGDKARLLPWHGRDEPPEVTGIPVADLYLSYLDLRPDSVVAALRAISEPDGATVVHCAAGKDRTGVVIAIALALAGVERSAIAADYAATEAQIGAIIRLLGRTATYRREVADPASVPAPRAEVIEAVLDVLQKRPGGIRGWLGEHGWTTQDNERFIDALID